MWKYEHARTLLKKQGRTREWLCEFCGVEYQTLTSYLNGRRNPSLPVLKLMARALETTVSELCPDHSREAPPLGEAQSAAS
jgi:putative transcriptional regulator